MPEIENPRDAYRRTLGSGERHWRRDTRQPREPPIYGSNLGCDRLNFLELFGELEILNDGGLDISELFEIAEDEFEQFRSAVENLPGTVGIDAPGGRQRSPNSISEASSITSSLAVTCGDY
ncbi:hypothetical protein [Salinarchaeum chitinilyticum]